MSQGSFPSGLEWLTNQVEREMKREKLSLGERVGEAAAVVCTSIVVIFFAVHMTRPTGFFTDDFSTADAVLLYLMVVIGVLPACVRLVLGRRNIARPFDVVSLAVCCVGSMYFLTKFPFDFAHFAEAFPDPLEFIISWISAGLVKILLVICAVVTPFVSAYTGLLYIGVKKRMLQPPVESVPADP